MEADTGVFQIETSGASSTPKDARLNGNVKIHITPKPGSKMNEIVVEMDDLVFSGERSEFATDQKVHIKSEQAELKGTGLIVIFDSAVGKIVFLRIRDLDEIRLQGLEEPRSKTKVVKTLPAPPTAISPVSQPSDEPASVPSEDTDGEELVPSADFYHCALEDNVKIRYGDEIIVSGADQINIQNILFSKLDQGSGVDREPKQAKEKSKPVDKFSPKQDQPAESKPDAQSDTEVLITCDGGITLEPMQDENIEQNHGARSVLPVRRSGLALRQAKIRSGIKHVPYLQAVNLTEETNVTEETDVAELSEDNIEKAALNQPLPTKFEAHRIDYDLQKGSGLAYGPVRFTFYQQPDPNSAMIPIVVTADKDAQFLADSSQTIEQVVFNGNVMTTRESQTQEFTQLDNLHSEKLIIDLTKTESGKVDLSHLRMTEGQVYVESQRMHENQKISDVKLYCKEISYDQLHDVILAEGPGKIELVNNQQPQTAEVDPTNAMGQPCVAMVDGFTTIRWNMSQQTIIAEGEKDAMKLAYYPIIEGRIQKQIFVYSMQLELSYLPDTAEVNKVFTDKSIIYEVWNGDMTKRLHYIVGQTLDYDRVKGGGWMKIEGTLAVPCNVDGSRMPQVFVHPVTGQIKASISTTPGILKSR